jgi:hypothetical protein
MNMTDRARSPIFIIGTERSGSNLLRLMLNAHSRIAIPHPPHFLRYLAPLAASYGDLRNPAARRRLTRDALLLLRRHIHPWEIAIDEDRVVAEADPSVFGVAAAIYEQYRRAVGKARWGCKSTFMIDHVDAAIAGYPDAQFLWLVRDPRDVAASSKRSVFNPCHPYLTAALWTAQQDRGFDALARLGPQRVHLLRYEQLVADPTRELDGVCRFLGEALEPAMLAHHRSAAAERMAGLSESWRNAGQPVTDASVGRFTRELRPDERRAVEKVAGPMMQRLHYDTDADAGAGGPLSMLELVEVHGRNALLRARVELRSLQHDANHWRRWSRDAATWWLRAKAALRAQPGARV